MPAAAVVPRFTVAGAAQAQQTSQVWGTDISRLARMPAKPSQGSREPSTNNLLAWLCDGPREKVSSSCIILLSEQSRQYQLLLPITCSSCTNYAIVKANKFLNFHPEKDQIARIVH
ncbi:hypothetical protein DFH08DRAFT_826300 [Mycena albidolilacea]|uniref:Uncharacterized protein n=1 Tax=Mycena albidolilacea TaxID=1033008 RepID=A0AAD6Z0F1_9AGAR|nr:hypothetical protein DFH08DRAFT_826300 [Mycena albidolilacea]